MEQREIKFEVAFRYKETGKIWKPILTLDELLDRNGCLYSPQIQEVLFKREFTGPKDKNGKDVYEGDILKSTYSDSLNNWLVEYKGAGFVIVNIGIDGYLGQRFPLETGDLTERIIIGNIYETPELLTPQTPQ